MNTSLNRSRKWEYLAAAFAIPFVAMLCIMISSGCTPFGTKSMLYSDCWHQYFPFFKAFRQALRNGENLLFSWDVGMGIDYLGLISYYLASPLNLLSALMPESWVLPYFSLLVPIKLGLASLFFAIFLKRIFGKNDLSIALFGAFYGLCAWALGYQWNIMWLDSFALLPLVALGTISLMRDKKYILYTISLFLAVAVNYYIGFFICIFVLLVFICYQICNFSTFKRLGEDFARIALFTVLAIGMTAVIEIPTLAALGNTHSSVNTYPSSFSLNIVKYADCAAARDAWKNYEKAVEAGEYAFAYWFTAVRESFAPILEGMRQVAGNMAGGISPTFKEGLPNVYSGVGTVVLAFLFLTSHEVKRRERICAVGLLLFFMMSFVIRQLDYIWHGFHFTNMIPYRFSFLFSFVMLYMAYRAYTMRHKFNVWQVLAAGALSVCVFLQSSITNSVESAWNALGELFELLGKTIAASSAQDVQAHEAALQSLDSLYKTHGDAYVFLVFNAVFFALYMILLVYPLFFKKKPAEQQENKKQKKEKKVVVQQEPSGFGRYFTPQKVATAFLALVMALELTMNVVNFGVNFSYTNIENYPRGTEYTESMIRYMKEREDTLFYRVETTHSQTLNDGALNDYNGISTFTSSANVKVTEFMRALGYAAKNTYNRYCYEESSPVANLFLNLKYMIEREGDLEENSYFETVHSYGDVYLLENKAYLPLGFLADSNLAKVDFFTTGMTPFVLQNNLFSAATRLPENVWQLLQSTDLTVRGENVTVKNTTATGYTAYEATGGSGKLIYSYTAPTEGFFCVDLTMPARNSFSVYHNGTFLYSESLTLPQTLAVCDVKPGDVVEIRATCKSNESDNMTMRAAILNDTVFQKGYDILAASTLELTEFSNTKITGTISCDRDGLLYTSIPYDGNWKATVDGAEADIHLIGGVMVGLQLTEGEHEVVFTYVNNAFNVGLAISVVCLLAFTFLIYWDHRDWFDPRIKNIISKIPRKK